MSDNAASEGARYWAFISYSHKDAGFGRRLHRRLESYALPRRLVGRATAQGSVPRRLAPIFRDREELPAANDLSAEVRAALRASRSLVVVCSPAAAASNWVSREVELFRSLHPDRPVLAALTQGEPGNAFPEILRRPSADGASVEPLAADFRRGRDGEQLGLLKLVAGMVGIGLDELVQRDAQRRSQRVTAVTAGALFAMLVMGVLTAFALNARSDAERQRAEAEGLVGFMITDLREKLEGVGRLDVMTAVNDKALAYFDRQSGSLSPDARARRAQILQAMGDDDESRGDRKAAEARFQEAYGITQELLAADPGNPERIFEHAQSKFWIGFADHAAGRDAQAKAAFQDYETLAEKMVALAPDNPRYVRELGFAEGDLCIQAFDPPVDKRAALNLCRVSMQHLDQAAHAMPKSGEIEAELSNHHAWLGDAYHINGDDTDALEQRLTQEKMLRELMVKEPMNMMYKLQWITNQRTLARMAMRAGRNADAAARLNRTSTFIDEMIIFDPTNDNWQQQKTKLDAELSKLTLTSQPRR